MGAPGNRALLPQRQDILAYLRSRDAAQLQRVESGAKGAGSVSVNFDEGYVLIVPSGKDLSAGMRLVWNRGDKDSNRSVAAGDYKVRRYVVSRKDDKGVEWQIWASGEGPDVAVRTGETTKIDLDTDVTFKAMLRRQGVKIMAGGSFSAEGRMGVSLVKGESRVQPVWKLLAGDREIAGGACVYG